MPNKKIKNAKKVGETQMQILENLLYSKEYVYYTRENPTTNVVEDIIFCHQKSHVYWRAFPHVLMIDATYKTNMYNLPFVQVVGVTSTHNSFCIANAFISKEREENYSWLLQRLKDMLDKSMEPRVIVTDREYALMNACKKVFPDASRCICRWHISEAIAKNHKASFSESSWSSFKHAWADLCDSSSEQLYNYNKNIIFEQLIKKNRQLVWHYLVTNWLNGNHEMFVSAWINKHHNFGQHTNNRVESQHRNLKRYLRTTNNTLASLVEFIDEVVKRQETKIRHAFETSIIKTMSHHRLPLFDNLRGRVSHKALDMLVAERGKLHFLRTNEATCTCHLFTSCGLPCACRLAKYENTDSPIPLSAVDVFWTKLDKQPALPVDEEVDIEEQMNLVKQQIMTQPPDVRKSMMKKILSAAFPWKNDKKTSVVQTATRGRPSAKAEQKKQQQDTQQSRHDPARHSSFVASTSSTKKPAMQRSSSTTSRVKGKSDVGGVFPLITDSKLLFNCARFEDVIPKLFHPYISHIQDVKPDGNCGFRAIAVGLEMDEMSWRFVRKQLLSAMDGYDGQYKVVFNTIQDGFYNEIRHSINYFDVAFAPGEHWLQMPYTGVLIAQTFGVIVHLLSIAGSCTFFPLWIGPRATQVVPHKVVSFVNLNNIHFIHVKLQGNYPMPPPNGLWSRYRNNAAAEWEELYEDRITDYKEKIHGTGEPQYVNIF